MTSNTTRSIPLSLVPFQTTSRCRFSTFERPIRPVPLPRPRVSIAMLLTPLHSTHPQRLFWQRGQQTNLLACGTCATSSQNCMRWSATANQSRPCRGIHLRSLFWPVPVMTVRSCSGTSAGPVRSRLQKMRRMDHLNCTLYTFQHPACCGWSLTAVF